MPTSADRHTPSPLPAPRRMPESLRRFLSTETAGGLVLLGGVVLALAWANSPWKAAYASFWGTELSVRLGRWSAREDLRHWVNEGLMTVFFFVVGLEIKREVVAGELRDRRTAVLPAVAALGGMVVPAGLYLAVNVGRPGAPGWGIPMATDIAFALGALALLGRRVRPALRLFLLTLAIVDDVGAITVIAVFYSDGIRWAPLAGAVLLLVGVGLLPRTRVYWLPAYGVVALAVWVLVFASGVHATIAGAALGLLAPARPLPVVQVVRRWSRDLAEEPSPARRSQMGEVASPTRSVAEWLEQTLHPFASFVVVPVFALANAGITFEGAALRAPGASAVVLGVVVGLVAGKVLGVAGFSYLTVRLGLGSLPSGLRWREIVGAGALAGVGFTVSLFIADLALGGDRLAAAKLGILAASALASLAGVGWLWVASRPKPAATPP